MGRTTVGIQLQVVRTVVCLDISRPCSIAEEQAIHCRKSISSYLGRTSSIYVPYTYRSSVFHVVIGLCSEYDVTTQVYVQGFCHIDRDCVCRYVYPGSSTYVQSGRPTGRSTRQTIPCNDCCDVSGIGGISKRGNPVVDGR